MIPLRRLVQTWKPDDWTTQDSVVRFTLVPEDGTTRIDLVHENVEETDYEGTDEGWDIYYLGAIKRMLEVQKPARRAKKKVAARKAPTRTKNTSSKKTVKPNGKSKKRTTAR